MDNYNGHSVLHQPTFPRSRPDREPEPAGPSLKVVQVRRGWGEDGNVARDRHFAAHPEDRDANVVIFHFCDVETADGG